MGIAEQIFLEQREKKEQISAASRELDYWLQEVHQALKFCSSIDKAAVKEILSSLQKILERYDSVFCVTFKTGEVMRKELQSIQNVTYYGLHYLKERSLKLLIEDIEELRPKVGVVVAIMNFSQGFGRQIFSGHAIDDGGVR